MASKAVPWVPLMLVSLLLAAQLGAVAVHLNLGLVTPVPAPPRPTPPRPSAPLPAPPRPSPPLPAPPRPSPPIPAPFV
jgi:hypothetical protein